MSVVFSGTNQGRFTSDGTAKILNIRSDVDWMYVYNYTVAAAAGADEGAQFYWQRGMAQGRGLEYRKTTATAALTIREIDAGAGFYLIDTSVNVPGPSLALTSISSAATPNVVTANTGSLSDGDIVRIFSTAGALQLGGLDFTIDSVTGGGFDLSYMSQIVAAAGPGTFRRIPYNPIFYPRNRVISNITQAVQAVVTLTVTHGFLPGQVIRFVMPRVTALAYGMTELDGVQATIVAVDTVNNTITVDIDTTGFTAFAFPLTADVPFTPAQVVPVGENTAEALQLNVNILSDATFNTALIGMLLKAGADSPGGVAEDVIYWVAGKSFSVDNQ